MQEGSNRPAFPAALCEEFQVCNLAALESLKEKLGPGEARNALEGIIREEENLRKSKEHWFQGYWEEYLKVRTRDVDAAILSLEIPHDAVGGRRVLPPSETELH